MNRYQRNRIYIGGKEQKTIQKCKIFIAGSGIGSIIAECALRLGFENLTIADGDTVELTNLNRQNYIYDDIGKSKAESIRCRLSKINPAANIRIIGDYIAAENAGAFVTGHDIAINALDFSSDIPFRFDEICQSANIPVLHPYNIGWAGLLFVIMPDGKELSFLSEESYQFESTVVKYVLDHLDEQHPGTRTWIKHVVEEYMAEGGKFPPPQLSVGSFLLAAGSTQLLYKLALDFPIKSFPEFYLFGLEDAIQAI